GVVCPSVASRIFTVDEEDVVRRRSRGVVVRTQDSESCDGSSNLHGDLQWRYKKPTELQTVSQTEDPELKYAAVVCPSVAWRMFTVDEEGVVAQVRWCSG
ncbi:unnamed protein product, partial [Enterobius vermicularis]|uniref:DPPIV_N domain-containing protein n=1 Tax=Enterobius vermicularis TaxID=51028 RepID=A0A0N4VP96_ENTVE